MKRKSGFIIALFLCCILNSCKTVESSSIYMHKTDTIYLSKTQRDSIFCHDSIYIYEKGDTIFLKEFHNKYIEIEKLDTVYQSLIDTCYILNTITVTEKKIPNWIWYVIGILSLFFFYTIGRWLIKLFRQKLSFGL